MPNDTKFGISAALATPYNEDKTINLTCLAAHSVQLLSSGCSSVTCFGTTAESPSLSATERLQTTDALITAGIRGEQIVLGIILNNLSEALDEARRGKELGCKFLLVAPPFYFKGLSDEEIYAWYASIISVLGDGGPRIILYHIPQLTLVPLSIPLVQRLKQDFPDHIYGVKDSSGDWPYSEQLLALKDLAILIGDERYLGQAAKLGAAGSISGVANFKAATLVEVLNSGESNTDINKLVNGLLAHKQIIPALKVVIGELSGDKRWRDVRLPLLPTDETGIEAIVKLTNDLFSSKSP